MVCMRDADGCLYVVVALPDYIAKPFDLQGLWSALSRLPIPSATGSRTIPPSFSVFSSLSCCYGLCVH